MFDWKTKDPLGEPSADYPQEKMNWQVKSKKGLVLNVGWDVS